MRRAPLVPLSALSSFILALQQYSWPCLALNAFSTDNASFSLLPWSRTFPATAPASTLRTPPMAMVGRGWKNDDFLEHLGGSGDDGKNEEDSGGNVESSRMKSFEEYQSKRRAFMERQRKLRNGPEPEGNNDGSEKPSIERINLDDINNGLPFPNPFPGNVEGNGGLNPDGGSRFRQMMSQSMQRQGLGRSMATGKYPIEQKIFLFDDEEEETPSDGSNDAETRS